MVSDKDRLYVGLYLRGGQAKMPGKEDTYHWALIIGPKVEEGSSRGIRLDAKDTAFGAEQNQWSFHENDCSLRATRQLLVRIVIAKIKDRNHLLEVLRKVPVVQSDPEWNCVVWVRQALMALENEGKAVGTSILDWQTVRDAVMEYCQKKIDAHRFDGKVEFDMTRPATYDFLENKETIP